MEGEHTREPWRLGSLQSYDAYTGKPFRNIWAGDGDDAVVVARCIDNGNCDEDAERIVACVNACRTIPVGLLKDAFIAERMAEQNLCLLQTVDQRDRVAAELRAVKAERDRLLGALKMAYLKHHCDHPEIGSAELSDQMGTVLADVMGDPGFQAWLRVSTRGV